MLPRLIINDQTVFIIWLPGRWVCGADTQLGGRSPGLAGARVAQQFNEKHFSGELHVRRHHLWNSPLRKTSFWQILSNKSRLPPSIIHKFLSSPKFGSSKSNWKFQYETPVNLSLQLVPQLVLLDLQPQTSQPCWANLPSSSRALDPERSIA